MKKETIIFFQELYLNSISRVKILSFCKEKQHADMQNNAPFLKQILIGDEACDVKKEYENLLHRVDMIRDPEDLLGIQSAFENLVSKANKYMFDSMQSINKRVFLPEEIKILHPLFEKHAVEKVQKMLSLSLYYLIGQGGLDIQKIVKSICDRPSFDLSRIVSCISIYAELSELIKLGAILQWKYILKQVEFDKLGKIPQYFIDGEDSIRKVSISGKPEVHYISDNGGPVCVVEGKGYLTNIDPAKDNIIELLSGNNWVLSEEDLTLKHSNIWELEFSLNPIEVLEQFFDGKPFIVAAPEYFRFANLCMLLQRVQLIFGD